MERRIANIPQGLTIEERSDGKRAIVGYAAVFYRTDDAGTEYRLASDAVERIAPTAFDRVLAGSVDVRGLVNHDPGQVLGRTTAGTMRLSTDSRGLRYEIDVPDTQIGRDLATSIQRGDITGSSFTFRVDSSGQRWQRDAARNVDVRTITSVSGLLDVGPVTFPAYESTSAAMRSDGNDESALNARKEWRRMEVDIRARLVALDAEGA